MKLFLRIIWLIKEEYLEFIRNFSPLVILLSLATVIAMHIERTNSGWDNVQIILTAVVFGALSLYAGTAAAAIFYRKAKEKLIQSALDEISRLKRQGKRNEAASLARKMRTRHFTAAFIVLFCMILAGVSVILILTYRMSAILYDDLAG